jgi:hypothetical protein
MSIYGSSFNVGFIVYLPVRMTVVLVDSAEVNQRRLVEFSIFLSSSCFNSRILDFHDRRNASLLFFYLSSKCSSVSSDLRSVAASELDKSSTYVCNNLAYTHCASAVDPKV